MSLVEVLMRWAYVSVGVFLFSFLALMFVESPSFEQFTWVSYGFFTLISLSLFFILWGVHLIKPSLNLTGPVFFLLGLRFLICATFITTYIIFFKTGDNYFILPFFLMYSIFTIFESIYLHKYCNYLEKSTR